MVVMMFGHMSSQVVSRREGLFTVEFVALVRPFSAVSSLMRFQMVRSAESLAAAFQFTLEWSLTAVRPAVLAQIALGGETFPAIGKRTFERVAGMQSTVSFQSIQSVERTVAFFLVANERFLFRVHTYVYAQTVAGQKSLATVDLFAYESQLSGMCFQMCAKIARRRVAATATTVRTHVSLLLLVMKMILFVLLLLSPLLFLFVLPLLM